MFYKISYYARWHFFLGIPEVSQFRTQLEEFRQFSWKNYKFVKYLKKFGEFLNRFKL